jgi:DNA-binding transcriptional MerR regulator
MSPLLDVREIAHLIAASAADEEMVFERIRHWTRERLLVPAQGLHPGTGNKRLYDPSVVQKARVLNELTALGVSMRLLQIVSEYMDSPDFGTIKKTPSEDVFLVVEKVRKKARPPENAPLIDRSTTSQELIDASWRAVLQAVKAENEFQDEIEFSLWRRAAPQQGPPLNKNTAAVVMVRL